MNNATTDVLVEILNDNFVEGDETFSLAITDVTSVALSRIGLYNSTTVTIIDNDSECMLLLYMYIVRYTFTSEQKGFLLKM